MDWMSAMEAARTLGVTRPTIRRWLDQGRLQGYKAGKVVRITTESVRALASGLVPDRVGASESDRLPDRIGG